MPAFAEQPRSLRPVIRRSQGARSEKVQCQLPESWMSCAWRKPPSAFPAGCKFGGHSTYTHGRDEMERPEQEKPAKSDLDAPTPSYMQRNLPAFTQQARSRAKRFPHEASLLKMIGAAHAGLAHVMAQHGQMADAVSAYRQALSPMTSQHTPTLGTYRGTGRSRR